MPGTGCVFFRPELSLPFEGKRMDSAMRPLRFSRAVVAVRGLQAKFSVICRAFSLLYSVHDFARLNSFELADDLEKK